MMMHMKYIIIIFMFLTIMYAILKKTLHPLNFMFMMIFFTMMILTLNFLNFKFNMYSFMIFITIIGSMMIMFLYFTSLISNNKSLTLIKEMSMIMFLLTVTIILYFILLNNNIYEEEIITPKININKIYMFPQIYLTMVTIFTLFYCLILSMKMVIKKKLPMRKINN